MKKSRIIIFFLVFAGSYIHAMQKDSPKPERQFDTLEYIFNDTKKSTDLVFENPTEKLQVQKSAIFGLILPFSIELHSSKTYSWKCDKIEKSVDSRIKVVLIQARFIPEKKVSAFVFLAAEKGIATAIFKNKINGTEETKNIDIEVVE